MNQTLLTQNIDSSLSILHSSSDWSMIWSSSQDSSFSIVMSIKIKLVLTNHSGLAAVKSLVGMVEIFCEDLPSRPLGTTSQDEKVANHQCFSWGNQMEAGSPDRVWVWAWFKAYHGINSRTRALLQTSGYWKDWVSVTNLKLPVRFGKIWGTHGGQQFDLQPLVFESNIKD